jgi:DNA-directed RNA polymerase alpha subunit
LKGEEVKQIVYDIPKKSAPTQRTLQSAGITDLNQLTKLTESDLLQLHGVGKNAVNILRDALSAQGFSFRHVNSSRKCNFEGC